jgi:UDP-N-acetylglucosamine 2-epimerase (non-hydrolysing)
MSDAFFQDLDLPEPRIHLGVGSGTHAEQTGKVMMAYEKILLEQQPDLVIVVGDVNSTVACTLAATKIVYPKVGRSQLSALSSQQMTSNENLASRIQDPGSSIKRKPGLHSMPYALCSLPFGRPIVAHLEAGLRSFDRTMPEEINRIVTDALADVLWTPSPDGDENLLREGVSPDKIRRVGNIMIDSLEMMRNSIERQAIYGDLGLTDREYGVVTLHRPANVDNPEILKDICEKLVGISEKVPLVFPVHPRTRKRLQETGLMEKLKAAKGLKVIEPLSYIPFMNLVFHCRLAITDSGGLQEETTYLGIPCLTMRPNTERPVTILEGTNQLCTVENLEDKVSEILSGKRSKHSVPDLWDGQTASRVVASIKGLFESADSAD